jgi:hypothetical protein
MDYEILCCVCSPDAHSNFDTSESVDVGTLLECVFEVTEAEHHRCTAH